ncbi:hypothetical protein AOQ84DRAFT_379578 [Glonium stellatum]|uniref:Uncharacterized protein n=1 Tax=Glonium stellatum TaxID=574774 RepID=A0A8E2EV57_9PEZI|nr:hypothetical protein AOQ84DRAFT_379578 [Glonium stellatum]
MLNGRGVIGLPKDEYIRAAEVATNTATILFYSAGYRRIGDSEWFCFAFDSSHASRKMMPEEDFNLEGELTELAKLERELEQNRITRPFELMIGVSDGFRGHPNDTVCKLLELRGILKPWPQDLFLQTKYGCTFSMYIGGFISPRMCHALVFQAEITGDDLQGDTPAGDSDGLHFDLWEHIPEPARSNMHTNGSMRMGFASFFHHAAAQEWLPNCKNFIERGGNAESVLVTTIQAAMRQDDIIGDGMYLAVQDSAARDGEEHEIHTLLSAEMTASRGL